MEDKTIHLLHFSLEEVQACLDLHYLDKVILLPALDFVPGNPDYFVGLMNYLGHTIPVIDLAWRIGLPRKNPYTVNTPVLLCTNQKHTVGLVVDKILGFETVSKEILQVPVEFKKPHYPFLATINFHTHFSLLINVDEILDISVSFDKLKVKSRVKPL